MEAGTSRVAMEVAHKLSFQLRAAEGKARELEAEVTHFRDRAERAEAWLLRIHNEVEHTFFEKERAQREFGIAAIIHVLLSNRQASGSGWSGSGRH